MTTIQWRPEVNPLTVPQSWRIRVIPRNVAGKKDIAADIALQHPNFSEEDILTILTAEDKAIKARLLKGEQVTKEGSFSYFLSCSGRLNSPEDPLPPLEECLQVNVRVSLLFLTDLRQDGQAERLPMEKRLPLINAAQDTLLKLHDVLNPAGVLQLTGNDLWFDPDAGGSCVLDGTESGQTAQTRLLAVSNSSVLLMPDLHSQSNSWNNEYKLSINTYYSEHGTLRTGTYSRLLRSPLIVEDFGGTLETGILTGKASSPYVSIIGGAAGNNEILRIQALLSLRDNCLFFNLIDLKEGGGEAEAVTVAGNGTFTLSGLGAGGVTSMVIRVDDYDSLKTMIRNDYNNRLVDILDVRKA